MQRSTCCRVSRSRGVYPPTEAASQHASPPPRRVPRSRLTQPSRSSNSSTCSTPLWALRHKAAASNDNGTGCVEVNLGTSGLVGVRDSKKPDAGSFAFPSTAWRTFLARLG
ncbi:MAG: DUF397 domain-containing protein [Kibdelosporangium sp.]